MGHLFSRALRRITHCTSQSRANQQEQNQTNASGDDKQQQQLQQQTGDGKTQLNKPVIVQSIPVGQSIDSSEFRAVLESNNDVTGATANKSIESAKKIDQEAKILDQSPNKENTNDNAVNVPTDENNKPDVEEAVIKIQAFVRGHLTRKALKDAQHNSMPAPNALGQSQFDEESLTKNPPSTVFLSSSPLNFNNADLSLQPTPGTTNSSRSPLESIVELTETNTQTTNQKQPQPRTAEQTQNDSTQLDSQVNLKGEETSESPRRKLSPLNTRSASSPSKIEMPPPQQQDSITRSMLPSEVNASIDLTCQTPASASIDIMDHNIKPIDKMATVLHIKENKKQEDLNVQPSINQETLVTAYMEQEEEQEGQPNVQPMETTRSPDSYESEEAAAIRIQSAFRGYRTRKNSPYRTRSPNSVCAQAKRNALMRQQQANVLHESDDVDVSDEKDKTDNGNNERKDPLMDPNEQLEAIEKAQTEGRRQSRPRQRESSPVIQAASSVDEFTTTEDTVKEALKMTDSHPEQRAQMLAQQSSQDVNVVRDKSQSLDITGNSLSEPAVTDTWNDINLSAALELDTQTTNNDIGNIATMVSARKGSGKESDVSVELDTDSSQLGAALSMNESEDISETPILQSTTLAQTILNPIDEMDKSLGFNITDELDLEAQRLVDELDSAEQQEADVSKENDSTQHEEQNECALEEATNELESVLESATEGMESLLLNEEEQRAIEMESDDIERRDPRGHVSEDRNSKSPQIRTEQPALITQEVGEGKGGELVQDEEYEDNLARETLKIGLNLESVSGRSSPALHSSANASSEEDNSDAEQRNGAHQHRNQQQSQQSKSGEGKNKKRNRNKRRNKK